MKTIRYDSINNEFELSEIDYFFNLAFQMTKRCNLSCVHCCESDYVPELETKGMIQIVNEMSRHGTKRVCVTGGEPTQRKDLEEILKAIKERGIETTLATNGYKLSIERLAELSQHISNIRLSLYGISETHDRISKKVGSQEQVIRTLENAQRLKIPAYICTSLMVSNLEDVDYVISVAQKYGVKKLVTFSLIDKGKGHDLFRNEQIRNSQVEEKISKLGQSGVKVYWTDFTREGQCAIVQPNGFLFGTPYPSNEASKFIVGSVLDEGLEALWEKYPFKLNYAEYYREKGK